MKNNKSKKILANVIKFLIIESLLISLLIVTCWGNRQHTETNTTKIYGKIDSIDLPHVYSALSSNQPTYFEVNGEQYVMYWKDGSRSVEDVVPELLGETAIIITLAKSRLFGNEMEVVDIRTEDTVYYDVSITNEWNENNRTTSLIVFGIILLMYTGIRISFFLYFRE